MAFTWYRYPTKRWQAEGRAHELRAVARTDGLVTTLAVDGAEVSQDRTPMMGPEAVRNHLHRTAHGLEVEAGYVGWWSVGAVARRGTQVLHETHPGRRVAFPEALRDQTVNSSYSAEKWRRNRLPIAVDIACALGFFVLAKSVGLTNAALAMAAVGIALVVAQRITRLDLTGGLALFGIAVSLLGAAYAWWFQNEEMVKLRGTILGLLTSGLFLADGLFGGRRLAGKLVRYLPYDDVDAGRLGVGMGVLGIVMAGLNYAVARLVSTDWWLLYTTFLDLPLVVAGTFAVFSHARGRLFRRAIS